MIEINLNNIYYYLRQKRSLTFLKFRLKLMVITESNH